MIPIDTFRKTRSVFIYTLYSNLAYSRYMGILKFIVENCFASEEDLYMNIKKCRSCNHMVIVRVDKNTVRRFCMFYITNVWSRNTIDDMFMSGNIGRFINLIGRSN